MPSLASLALALVEPATTQPEATRQLPPDPVGGGAIWVALVAMLLTAWLVVVARRRAGRSDRPGGFRSLPGGAAIGNAMADLASMLQPDRPDAAVIQKLEEEGEHDERGDGRDPERESAGPSPRKPRQSPHE